MRTMCSREIFTKKCRQQQIFDSDLKGVWHYNHVTFTPIAKKFMLYCRSIYMLSILCVRLTIKVKVGIPESFKVGWYPHPPPKKLGRVTLKGLNSWHIQVFQLCKFSHWHKIKNISANNEAMLLKLGRDIAPYEIYQMVRILMLLWQHAWFQSSASSKWNITICDSIRQIPGLIWDACQSLLHWVSFNIFYLILVFVMFFYSSKSIKVI